MIPTLRARFFALIPLAFLYPVTEPTGNPRLIEGHVSVVATTTDGRAAFGFKEAGRIGGLDVPTAQQFQSRLITLAVTGTGKLMVLDAAQGAIRVFEKDGTLIRDFGRVGQGPGELEAPIGMALFADGTVVVPNGFNRRYTVFGPEGDLIDTERRPSSSLLNLTATLPTVTDSTFIDEYAELGNSSAVIHLVEISRAGLIKDTLSSVSVPLPRSGPRKPLAPGSVGADVSRHYIPRPIFFLHPDGAVWIVDNVEGTLHRRNHPTAPNREWDLTHLRRELSRVERQVITRGLREAGLSEDEVDIASSVATGILAGPHGSILATQFREHGEIPTKANWIGPGGDYLGEVDLGFRVAPGGIGTVSGDTVFAVGVGELDVPFVIWGTIESVGD